MFRLPSLLRCQPSALLAPALVALALLPAAASARMNKLERLVVIGDSYSDGGNSGLLTLSAVPPSGFPPSPYVGGDSPMGRWRWSSSGSCITPRGRA